MIQAFTEPSRGTTARGRLLLLFTFLALSLFAATGEAMAHAVAEGDKGYIQEISGVNILAFLYLGAKHMVTGYDHILFLFGIIFFLYRMKHIALYVSLFAIGHSTTMLLGVFFDFGINS
ncbi:MAG: HupE/UreJ family protein, partial [Sphingopyxis terrae]